MKIIIPKDIELLDDLIINNQCLEPFSDVLISFVDAVSKAILKDKFFKDYPELIALAFWMRKSHINELHKYFLKEKNKKILIGRGVVFHMAPSNVDTIFVYSWFISFLVGNSNILRISDKGNLQTDILLEVIAKVLESNEYQILQDRVAIIKYGHEDSVTEKLSLMANVRVIWGGDNTINHIRTIPIQPTATELTFADKFSFAVINSKKLLEDKDIDRVIERFYNDSFWFGQMACSSIRLISWIGNVEDNVGAQKQFWLKLNEYVLIKKPEDITPSDIVNKLVAECSMAIDSNIKVQKVDNPFINIVKIDSIKDVSEDLHCGTGLFYEMELESLELLIPFMSKKHQTISYYGFQKSEFRDMIYQNLPEGIDRIVPIGKSLDFSNIWDGFDLFKSFSREIEILD